jgi:hypothetical protein
MRAFGTDRPRRRYTAWAAATLLVGGLLGCSVEQTLPPPYCETSGSGLIVAQSVPPATQIPCLSDLPAGWSVSTVKVNEHHSVVTLDSDRAGDGAAVLRFEDSCDVSAAVSAPSELLLAERYDAIEQVRPSFRAERFYVFDGGCVYWTFDFDAGVSATESVAIGDILTLISRADLQRSISETFLDEEI